MTRIITITASKGGVTKTTTAVTLAHALAGQQKKVLLIDTDPQGHCAISLGMDPEPCLFNVLATDAPLINNLRSTNRPNLWLLPSNQKTKTLVSLLAVQIAQGDIGRSDIAEHFHKLAEDYDALVFDTAAAGILQEIAVGMADVVIIPTALDNLAMDGVAHTLAAVEKFNPQAQRIILPTLYQRQSLYDANLQLLQEAYSGLVCAPVPHSAAVREAVAHGQTIWEFVARSETLTAAREVYAELTQRIIQPEASS